MKNYVLSLLVLVGMATGVGYGQNGAVCPDTIFLCPNSNNVIKINNIPGIYTLRLTGQTALNSTFTINSDGKTLNFYLGRTDLSIGNFNIYIGSQLICSGRYIAFIPTFFYEINDNSQESCSKYNPNGQLIFSKCQDSILSLQNAVPIVCTGDTTLFNFIYENSPSANYPSKVSDLFIAGGELLSFNSLGGFNNNFAIKWNQPGYHCITLESRNNTCNGSFSFTILVQDRKKLKIENNSPSPDNKYCKGQKLHLSYKPFPSEATYAEQKFEWKLSDGRVFYTSDLNIDLVQSGELTVILTELSDCQCSEPDTLKLDVGIGSRPKIECTGSVCIGDEVYYSTKNLCTNYIWSVSSHGQIIEGGSPTDSYIKIKWTQGGAAKLSLSLPSCSGSFCSNTHEEIIEVLSPIVNIEGPKMICASKGIYSIPAFAGTIINWTIPDNKGYISSGQGTNTVIVTWSNENQDFDSKIVVTVTDCNNACNGSGELTIQYRAPDAIKTNKSNFCINEIATLYSEKGRKYDWTITLPDANTTNYSQVNFINIPMTQVGEWKVMAIDPTGCLTSSKFNIKVSKVDKPVVPLSFDQPCQDSITFFALPNLAQNLIVNWTIFDGNLSFPAVQTTSRQTSYVWKTSGPYSVKYSIKDIYTSCVSDEIISSPSSTINIVGDANACIFESSKYDIDGTSKTLNWSITPPDGGQIINISKDSVSVKWLKTGTHQLRGQGCSAATVLNVKVHALPVITLNYPNPICPGTQANVNVALNQPGTVRILDSLRNLIANQPTTMVPDGQYYVEATDNNGCVTESEFKIEESEPFDVYISSPDPNRYCTITGTVTIVSEQFPVGYLYQWFKNGAIIGGEINPTISVSDFGMYQVRVTSPNLCAVISNPYTIVKDCGGGGGSVVCGIRNLISISCDDQKFEVEQPYLSTDFTWIFLDPFSTNNNTNGLSATHSFSKAGYYEVNAFGNKNNEVGRFKVKIPIVAAFDWKQNCGNNEIQFTDKSSYIDPSTVDKYVWDFGEPSSGVNNTSTAQNPKHIYTALGTYLVKLRVLDLGGCYTEYEETIDVQPNNIVGFVHQDSVCLATKVLFEPIADPNIKSITWVIFNTTTTEVDTIRKEKFEYIFSKEGLYRVTLIARLKQGCLVEAYHDVLVVNHRLSLPITTATVMPKCPTELAILNAPSGNFAYKWQDGSTGASISVLAENQYRLTVTDLSGCTFTPSIHVTNHIMSQSKIEGLYDYNSNVGEFSSRSFDSISICQNVFFQLTTAVIPNTTVSYPAYNSVNATPGRYLFLAKIKSTIANCEVEIGPFVVNVKPKPSLPIIDVGSDQCVNSFKAITVKNIVPDHIYQWSTGQNGSVIQAFSGGVYSVTSTKNGCSSTNAIMLYDPPSTDFWASGCKEVCLPYKQCINLSASTNKYYLIANGGVETPIINLSLVDITKVGDYQIKALSNVGCIDTSEVLSVSAKHDDHSIGGIIFHDINENGLFDGIDTLVPNIKVGLYHSNSLVITDTDVADAQYLFDSVTVSNLTVKIVGSTFGYQIVPGIDSLVTYKNCIEDKDHDIPLIYRCLSSREVNSYLICEGDSVIINNFVIKTNTIDSLLMFNSVGCDSVLVYVVAVAQNPQASLEINAPCISEMNGSVTILDFDLNENKYSFDNSSPITNNQITQLGAGNHTLTIENSLGCKTQIPIVLSEPSKPDLNISTNTACPGTATGSIDILTNDVLNYSIDNSNLITSVPSFDLLSAGNHIVIAIDSNGCKYAYPFVIDTFILVKTTLATVNTCPNAASGLIIVSNDGSTYALNNKTNYTSQVIYPFLPKGSHFVSVKTIEGCIYDITAEILNDPNPDIIISTKPSCVSDSNGTVSLINNSTHTNMRFSLDSVTFTSTPTLVNIPSGSYTLYVLPSNNCIYSYPFDIKSIPNPNIDAVATNTCQDSLSGQIVLTKFNPLFTYKLNNDVITTSSIEKLGLGTYNLSVVDTSGCQNSTTLSITNHPPLDVDYPTFEIDCSIDQIDIIPNVKSHHGNISYQWSNGSSSPSISISTSGLYEVNITDLCSRSKQQWNIAFTEPEDDGNHLFNPNIFSISATSTDNRCFKMTKNPIIDIITFDMSVYDRWGNLVYTSSDLNGCWDGTFKGRKCEKGVYVYLVKYTYTDCQKIHGAKKYGDVTLLD